MVKNKGRGLTLPSLVIQLLGEEDVQQDSCNRISYYPTNYERYQPSQVPQNPLKHIYLL